MPATRATRWSTPCAWASCGTATCRRRWRAEPGNKVVLFGSRTGPDGVGGASVLASATFGDDGGKAAKRPSVQVGDPFLEKLLVECCLELYAADLVEGIQDLGAAGIACATTELAAGGDGGMRVDLDASRCATRASPRPRS